MEKISPEKTKFKKFCLKTKEIRYTKTLISFQNKKKSEENTTKLKKSLKLFTFQKNIKKVIKSTNQIKNIISLD